LFLAIKGLLYFPYNDSFNDLYIQKDHKWNFIHIFAPTRFQKDFEIPRDHLIAQAVYPMYTHWLVIIGMRLHS